MSAIPQPTTFTITPGAEAGQPMLSRLEWKVVALALHEASERGCSGIMPPSRLTRLFRRIGRALTGWEGPRPLADPRLETLRRFVCTSRWGHRDAAVLAQRLVEQGFSQHQVRAVAMLVAR
ncbi:MAG TPA: hypothetical protein VNQ31_00635 [Sphingomonadaceae bacterium]|nr:hypothetical protein [Sphingomonadaceae bacterium]